jgi:hypothetical protein
VQQVEVLARWVELQVVNSEEEVVGEHLEQPMGEVGEVLLVKHAQKQNEQLGQQWMAELLAGPGEGEALIVKVPAGEEVPGRKGLLVEVVEDRMGFVKQAEGEVCPVLGVEGVRGEAARLGPW